MHKRERSTAHSQTKKGVSRFLEFLLTFSLISRDFSQVS